MRLTVRGALSIPAAALVLFVFTSIRGAAQAPAAPAPAPEREYKNLKVLPPDTTKPQMIVIMHGFADALGQRCDFCHVSKDGKMDFASDEKDEKRSARVMMKMTQAINKETLPELEGMSDDAEVTCYTCHRGAKHPTREMAAILTETATQKGPAGAVEQFKTLREKNAESGLYDFRPLQLTIAADRLHEAKKPDEALGLLKATVALFPSSADAAASLGAALARAGDKVAAEAELQRALTLDPGNRMAKGTLERLKGGGAPPR